MRTKDPLCESISELQFFTISTHAKTQRRKDEADVRFVLGGDV
jgi:hypothetical protein